MKLKYVPCLDGIRAVALGITFAGHAGLGSFIPGTFGVTIFFFLSGYLITSLLRAEWSETQDISLRKFYYRRALRILPPLYIILALGWTLDSFGIPVHQGTGFALVSILLYFYNYAMLTKLSLGGIPVGFSVFWSLMVEEHFYLIFPFIYLLVRKIAWPTRYLVNALIGVNIIVLIWRIVLIYVFHTPANTYGWAYLATDARFDSILWGCVLAVGANPWAGDKNRFIGHNPGRIALASLFLLAGVIALRNPDFAYSIRPTLQGVALMPIFYYLVAVPEADGPGFWPRHLCAGSDLFPTPCISRMIGSCSHCASGCLVIWQSLLFVPWHSAPFSARLSGVASRILSDASSAGNILKQASLPTRRESTYCMYSWNQFNARSRTSRRCSGRRKAWPSLG